MKSKLVARGILSMPSGGLEAVLVLGMATRVWGRYLREQNRGLHVHIW